MKDPDKLLKRLAAASRREETQSADGLPFGLATRVLARFREGREPSLWGSLALGALPVAIVVTMGCFLLGSPDAPPADDAGAIASLMVETQLPAAP